LISCVCVLPSRLILFVLIFSLVPGPLLLLRGPLLTAPVLPCIKLRAELPVQAGGTSWRRQHQNCPPSPTAAPFVLRVGRESALSLFGTTSPSRAARSGFPTLASLLKAELCQPLHPAPHPPGLWENFMAPEGLTAPASLDLLLFSHLN
jgi:hypothetical protein